MPAQSPAGGEALCRFAHELLDETDAIAPRHVAAWLRVRVKADTTPWRPGGGPVRGR